MKKTYLLFICLILISNKQIFAKGVGTTGCSFLKIDTVARPVGMGGAFSGISDDVNAIRYNPAGLSQINKAEVTLTHNEWIQDIKNEFVGYAQPVGKDWTLGLTLNYLYTTGLIKRDINGNTLDGTFGANDGMSTLSFSKRFNDNIHLGTNMKIVREVIEERNDIAYAVDFGLLYKISDLNIGVVAQNIGSKIELYQESFSLPLSLRIGLGIKYIKNAIIGIDAAKSIDNQNDFRIGGEYLLFDILALRAGYKFNQDENTGKGIHGGAGVKYKNYQADFAFVPYGDLGNTYRISLTFRFGHSQTK
ncbi:MAG TPA: hypothetical protein DCP53_01090 [Elusimicrobia bacterium]|nr:hypothetical protein [Elusimicrobiota bacterium]